MARSYWTSPVNHPSGNKFYWAATMCWGNYEELGVIRACVPATPPGVHVCGCMNRTEAHSHSDVVQPHSIEKHPHSNCFQFGVSRWVPLHWGVDLEYPTAWMFHRHLKPNQTFDQPHPTCSSHEHWRSALIPLPTPNPRISGRKIFKFCAITAGPSWEFPGGPVIRTLCFHWEPGFSPCLGIYDS